MPRKNKIILFAALVFLLFLSLSCNLPSLLLGDPKQFKDGLVQDYHPAASSVSQYTLSATQQDYVDEYGNPDRFVIFFFDEVLADGQLFSMRHENWYYDARGYEIVFRNGDKFTERNGNPIQIEGLGHTPYTPQGFTAEMNLDGLLNIQGETGFFVQNVDDELITGELIFIQGLAAGFEEGRLSYVETLPLSEASWSTETSSLEENTEGLTPQELAHQGTHTYEVTCANESLNSSAMVWTFEFIDGSLNLDDGGLPYPEIGVNTYGFIDDDGGGCTWTFTNAEARKECPGELSCVFLRK